MSAPLARARILLVGNYPPPHGGIAVHLQALHRRLLEEDAWVRVLALGEAERSPGVQPIGGPRELATQLAAHAALGFLVHVQTSGHTPKSWAIAAAASALRGPRAPAPVLTLHSGLLPNFLALGEGRRRLARTVCGAFGQVFAVNSLLERALLDAGVDARRLAVAPAASGPLVAGPAPASLAALRERSAPLLACAIAPSAIYGARPLLAALPVLVARLPRVGLALFGPGSIAGLRALACRLGVEQRVAFLGELGRADALGVLGACDLFLRPSLADGDALSVREALALGKPVVATDVGARPAGVRTYRYGEPLALCGQVELAWQQGAGARAVPGDELAPVIDAYRRLLRIESAAPRAAGEG